MIPFAALLIPLVMMAIFVVVIILILRRVARNASNMPRRPVQIGIRASPDGFWLSSLEPGSVIYYQYWAGGVQRRGQIVFQPGNDGRQFVYTGMQPETVEIIRVVDQSGGFGTGPVVYDDDTPSIVPPIVGGIAVGEVLDALTNTPPQAPAPPAPAQFP